ncbi:MAG TPA: LysE family translocator [Candidatus Limnocylindria bacterium]|nr:LysE family translocator [Candidatus Limnocylindria bacterium]
MIDPSLVAFVGIAALLTILPGVDMALVAKVTLQDGKGAAFFTSLGISSGLPVHATASALGLSLILSTSATAFTIVKIAGALYLTYLGVQSLLYGARPGRAKPGPGARTRRAAFLQGFLNNVLNPKVALFYLTFLPQFINPGDNVLLKSLFLAGIHVTLGLIWLTTYAYAIERLAAVMQGARRGLERVSGVALVALGVRLALERR